ncbi:MAG: DUF6683 family protein [Fimbriimonadales bacterium]
MKHKTLRNFSFCAVCLAGMAAKAQAQYTNSYGYTFNNPVSASCNAASWDGMNSRLIYRMILKKHGYTDAQLGKMSTKEMYDKIEGSDPEAPKKEQAAIVPASPASRFKPSGKRVLLPELVKSLTQDAGQQNSLTQLFESGFESFDKEAKKNGLSNDLAGSVAFFIGSAYMVYRDGEAPNEDGLLILAHALQLSFNTPAMRKIPDLDKQKFHEFMVTMGTYFLVARQTSIDQRDAAMAQQIKDAATAILKGYLKIDPSKFKITANGLEVSN